jgi:hypothetical protein
METFVTRLDPVMIKQIEKLAKEKGMGPSQLVRLAVYEYVVKNAPLVFREAK